MVVVIISIRKSIEIQNDQSVKIWVIEQKSQGLDIQCVQGDM